MNFIELTKEKLDINSISMLIGDNCPVILFIRTEGNSFGEKKVSFLKQKSRKLVFMINAGIQAKPIFQMKKNIFRLIQSTLNNISAFSLFSRN